ncbi:MAG: alpha/beta fold hydrolase [Deltaproteobacteria bacterium]|nr:alpha/beta fold hydrolase [Deltaproteobacteria bacterium]
MTGSVDAGTITPMPAATNHHITVNNLRIHYTEAGSGPPILLLHGFPTSSHLWRNVMPGLAKTHRAIAIDLPGYGLADKPLDAKYNFAFYETILEGFLDALDIHDTDLVVHDLGGPVGMFWAVRHPQRVKNIVVLNTLVYPETSWAVKLFLLALRTPGRAPGPHQGRLRPQHQRPPRNRPQAPHPRSPPPPHLRRERPHPPRHRQNHATHPARPPRHRAHRASRLRALFAGG